LQGPLASTTGNPDVRTALGICSSTAVELQFGGELLRQDWFSALFQDSGQSLV
jgi:hypothetical protein